MGTYRVRVKYSYPDVSMQGVEVVILEYDNDTSLIGFPLNSSLGGMTVIIVSSIVAGGFPNTI